ncbi:MAG: hypothetical protein S4CHLAM81_05640 [Chlamydiales bacterium]|nr:hypothetical protein [Chlamydiales bacterium]MCH9635349.1 hypothetical protein [Chlamydiales bacterium]MCH9704058.1 hypothetical protein [Chlamydiota bacterium]
MAINGSTETLSGMAAGAAVAAEQAQQNRCFWEDSMLGGGSFCSAVGSISSFAMNFKFFGGGFAGATLIMLVALWRIRQIRPEKVLSEQITQLQQEKGDLEKTVTRLEGEMDELSTLKEQLRVQVQGFQEQEKKQLEELQQAQQELSAAVAKFEGVKALYEEYKTKTEAFLHHLSDVRSAQDAVVDEINSEELGQSLAGLETEREALGQSLENFRQLVNGVSDDFSNMKAQIATLKDEVVKVQESAAAFKAGADSLTRAAEAFGSRMDEIDRI